MVRSRRLPDKVYRSLPSLRVEWHGGGGRDVVFPVECACFLIILPDADVMLCVNHIGSARWLMDFGVQATAY